MTQSDNINLVTVTDNHYLILLAALVKSIEANLSNQRMLDLWVVDCGLTRANIEKLEGSIDPGITRLHWKKIKEVIPANARLPLDYSSWPINIYARLFVPDFIPKELTRILFMDVDIINCRNLGELWETDLEGNIIGAVRDSDVLTFDNHWGGGVLNYKDLGLAGDTRYFNSGVLLIDVEKWRSSNVAQRTVDCINKNRRFAKYPDQYGLNVVLANQWLELAPGWNHFPVEDDVTPHNIHFIERKPIYKTYSNSHAYRNLFYHYRDQTQWKDAKPVGEPKRYAKKLMNVLDKLRMKFA